MSWHSEEVDKHGNVSCLKCGRVQADSFKACIDCCSHNNMEFDEEYDNGWHLVVLCSDCGNVIIWDCHEKGDCIWAIPCLATII